MTPDAIRTHAPKILTAAQRDAYFETDFLCAEGLIPDAWLRRLRALVDRHPDFWRFAAESPLADIAADLVEPDVKFRSSKLNYKWAWTGSVRANWSKLGYGSIFVAQKAEM